jgi:hypothetical protein
MQFAYIASETSQTSFREPTRTRAVIRSSMRHLTFKLVVELDGKRNQRVRQQRRQRKTGSGGTRDENRLAFVSRLHDWDFTAAVLW